jgi:hypothetical protein
MFEACLAVPGVEVCASGGLTAATGLSVGRSGHIIVPSSVFFHSLAATLGVTQVGHGAFYSRLVTSMLIPRHVQIRCSSCFSGCKSLSSISFETDSELTRIESNPFA